MSSLTVEEKLLLIQKMRNNSEKNNFNMQKRDHMYRGLDSESDEDAFYDQPLDGFRFFKYRILICFLALGTFIFMDQRGIRLQGHTASEVVKILQSSENLGKMETVMETWSENTVDKFVKTL